MRWPITSVALMLCSCLPTPAAAAVYISEIAWMGSPSSPNHEWIELHNSGDTAVDVSDWTLSDGNNLTIQLSNAPTPVIPAGAYVLLKRTSDASAPGPTFLIYTGALVNGGATLTLQRGDGTVVDQVVGGENWQNIGGDNTTKDTPQYTPNGWITAAPTPGAPNATQPSTPPVTPATPTGTSTQSTSQATTAAASAASTQPIRRTSGSSETVRLTIPNVSLQLTISGQTIGYVNQPIDFSVVATGLGDTWLRSLSYTWNFGDGFGVAGGPTSTYAFAYPGTYVVTVHAHYGRHEQVGRHEITILPTTLSLAEDAAGNLLVHNDAPYEVDVSGFTIRGAARSHTFPPRTIMLPYQTITIPRRLIAATDPSLVALYDTARTLVASNAAVVQPLSNVATTYLAGAATPEASPAPVALVVESNPAPPLVSPPVPAAESELSPTVAGLVTTAAAASADETTPLPAAPTPDPTTANPIAWPVEWWLLGLLLAAFIALSIRPRPTAAAADTVSLPSAPPPTNPFL